MAQAEPALRSVADHTFKCIGLVKSYGGVIVLKGVSITVPAGGVVGLIGENGAGKSTLSGIIAGNVIPDSGSMTLDGEPYAPNSPADALRRGVVMVHQEIRLVPGLSVAENICIGRVPMLGGRIDRRRMEREARVALELLGVNIDPRRPVAGLSMGVQQEIEIAKALARQPRYVIFDEPSASLSERETERILSKIDALRREGVGVIYISHRLEEVRQVAQEIVCLRDGALVRSWDTGDIHKDELVGAMVGRDFVFEHHAPQPAEDQIVLEVRDLARTGVFEGINFSVARGEILGIAGLVGAGRTEVVRTIAGADRFDRGEVRLEGTLLKLRSPADAIRAGIVMVPEDRKGQGLLLTRSCAENIAHPWERMLWSTGLITKAKVKKLAEKSREEFDIRGSMAGLAGGLSGGNQQKVLLAKWLVKTPKVLILDEPTRGVDVGAKMAIYEIVRQLAAKGLSVIVVSSELEEVLGLSHRVLVMAAGRQRAVLRREAAKAETVMHFAVPVQHRLSHADPVEAEIDGNDLDEQRLATKAAWLYHNRKLQQPDIAARLGISLPRVSRLLELAVSMGIVRTTVVPPEGLHAELEAQLEQRYGLREAHVFDVGHATDDEHELTSALGQLIAARLQTQRLEAPVIGVTSWSRSLQATIAALQPLHWSVDCVVETLGDIGPIMFQHEAADATRQLAVHTGAEALFLRIPGVTPNKTLRDALLAHDPDVRRALDFLDVMDMALVGIGTSEITSPLVAGKNFFTAEQYRRARELGAVGEVCLHFIAEDGSPVATDLDELLVGVTLEQLRRTKRVLAVAGGSRKYRAIRAALLGGWVNSLVTDLATAQYLIAH